MPHRIGVVAASRSETQKAGTSPPIRHPLLESHALFHWSGLHDVALHYAGTIFTGDCQVTNYGQVRTGPETGVIVTQLVIAASELVEEAS